MNNTAIQSRKCKETMLVNSTEILRMDSEKRTSSCERVTIDDVVEIVDNMFKLGDEYLNQLFTLAGISDFVQELDKIVFHVDVESMTGLQKMFSRKRINQNLLNIFEEYRYRYVFLDRNQKYMCSDSENWSKISEEKCKYLQRINEQHDCIKMLYDNLNEIPTSDSVCSVQRVFLKRTLDDVENWIIKLKNIENVVLFQFLEKYQVLYKMLNENNTWDAIQVIKTIIKSYQKMLKFVTL